MYEIPDNIAILSKKGTALKKSIWTLYCIVTKKRMTSIRGNSKSGLIQEPQNIFP